MVAGARAAEMVEGVMVVVGMEEAYANSDSDLFGALHPLPHTHNPAVRVAAVRVAVVRAAAVKAVVVKAEGGLVVVRAVVVR